MGGYLELSSTHVSDRTKLLHNSQEYLVSLDIVYAQINMLITFIRAQPVPTCWPTSPPTIVCQRVGAVCYRFWPNKKHVITIVLIYRRNSKTFLSLPYWNHFSKYYFNFFVIFHADFEAKWHCRGKCWNRKGKLIHTKCVGFFLVVIFLEW